MVIINPILKYNRNIFYSKFFPTNFNNPKLKQKYSPVNSTADIEIILDINVQPIILTYSIPKGFIFGRPAGSGIFKRTKRYFVFNIFIIVESC